MDYAGDWATEYDYSTQEWFTGPPPTQKQPEQHTPKAAYIPEPLVIERNDVFCYALKAAPAVLYERYKQYGQLGVLAWCAEFGEMIDELKGFGTAGHMFTATRTQALDTCRELLALLTESKIEVQMQIIIIYLSSLVARLRKFLDANTEFEDYPQPNFPGMENPTYR